MSRVALVHAFAPSMSPLQEAFRAGWPDADVVNFLDESLYADVGADGSAPPGMTERMRSLFRHAELSGAAIIVFTGTTFGPVVEQAKDACSIPVLKADEALADAAIAAGRRILILFTAKRALPVVRANFDQAAAKAERGVDIREAVVEGAQAALLAGDREGHDRLIADAVRRAQDVDVIALAQMSMAGAATALPALSDRLVLTSPQAAVRAVRRLLG